MHSAVKHFDLVVDLSRALTTRWVIALMSPQLARSKV